MVNVAFQRVLSDGQPWHKHSLTLWARSESLTTWHLLVTTSSLLPSMALLAWQGHQQLPRADLRLLLLLCKMGQVLVAAGNGQQHHSHRSLAVAGCLQNHLLTGCGENSESSEK